MQGSVFRRKNSKTGELSKSWTVKYDFYDELGQRVQKMKGGFKTKKAGQEFLTKVMNEIQLGTYSEPSKQTFGEYLQYWLKNYAETNTALRTYEGYKYIIEGHIIPALGHIPLQRLQPVQLQAYYTEKRENGRLDSEEGGLSKRTLLHQHRVISEALKQAVRWGLVPRNVAEAVEAPRPDAVEMIALTPEEVDKLLNAAESYQTNQARTEVEYPSIIFVAVNTGLRRGELLALRWKDVNFQNSTISVQQTIQRVVGKGLIFKEPKTSKSRRTIKVTTSVTNVLKKMKLKQSEWKLKLSSGYNDQDLVFTQPDGTPIEPTELVRIFRRIVENAALPPVRFHDLRHTFATMMLGAGVPIKVISEMLGHSDIGITLRTYTHTTTDMQETAVQKLDDLLSRARKKTP